MSNLDGFCALQMYLGFVHDYGSKLNTHDLTTYHNTQ